MNFKYFVFSASLTMVALLCGCTIGTTVCEMDDSSQVHAPQQLTYKLYLRTLTGIGNDINSFRTTLIKNNPDVFTADADAGIPFSVDVQKSMEKESGSLNALALCTLGTLVPFSNYKIETYTIKCKIGNLSRERKLKYKIHEITGITPLTYLLYPFVGWSTDEKGLGSCAPLSLDHPVFLKTFSTCIASFNIAEVNYYYRHTPKQIIFPQRNSQQKKK